MPLGRWPAWTRPLVFNLLDLAGALVALAGLILSLLAGVVLMNHLAPQPVLSLTRLFVDLRPGSGGPDMTWLYLMVFSTLLPTLAHFVLFAVSLLMRFPAAYGRLVIARFVTGTGEDQLRVNTACTLLAIWAALWVLAGLAVLHMIPGWAVWHDTALTWIIDRVLLLSFDLGLI